MPKAKPISLDGNSLTLEQLESVARHDADVVLSPKAQKAVQAAAQSLHRLAASGEHIYGITSGFGLFAERKIDASLASQLSRNLILSHAAGFGDPFPMDVVRAAMLVRANTLARGHSGVRVEVIDTLLQLLRLGVTPLVPSQGSLGSSGDLAPLAHLALVITADQGQPHGEPSGQAWYGGRLMTGAEAMRKAGIPRLVLGAKEGLALTNGATFSASMLSLACIDARKLLRIANIAAAMTLEALLGVSAALDARLHQARPHPGQVAVAQRLRALTSGSQLLDAADRLQDAYSLRCVPQIIGPVWELLDFTEQVIIRELNASTDNPLLFDNQPLSGGNFHGEPVAMAADYLKIALSEVGALSERRVFRLTDATSNFGLPPMLIGDPANAGIQSGFMMLHYTAASLVLENQFLATPDSVRSLPTSAGQEDHNANATTACRHLQQMVANLRAILAIELITAAQALELRIQSMPDAKPGVGTSAAFRAIRQVLPFSTDDHPLATDLQRIDAFIQSGELLDAVDRALG